VSRLRELLAIVAVATVAFGVGPASPAWAARVSDQPPPAGVLGVDAGLSVSPQGDTTTVTVPDVPAPSSVPDIGITVDSQDGGLSRAVLIVLMLAVASVVPLLLLLMTSFTRFVVVLGLTRNAIGIQNIPPTQVLIGLAFFLTLFVMSPMLSTIKTEAVDPLLAGEIDQGQAIEIASKPIKQFMLDQTREEDLALFISMSGQEKPATPEDVTLATLIPAFVVSELTTAFMIGFLIYVPFLVIDLIVSAVLMALGMVMLPPVFISLPLKLLLFVLVNGWALIIGSVVQSVGSLS